MLGDKNSYVVLGEASESDEDETMEQSLPVVVEGISNIVVKEEHNVAVEAFKAKAEEAKYNSLLHKKLKESNYKLKEDLRQLTTRSLKFTSDQVSEINQRLIRNQVEIQDTIKYLKKSSKAVTKVDNIMSYLLTQNFLPTIKIDV